MNEKQVSLHLPGNPFDLQKQAENHFKSNGWGPERASDDLAALLTACGTGTQHVIEPIGETYNLSEGEAERLVALPQERKAANGLARFIKKSIKSTDSAGYISQQEMGRQ